jgi:TolA-binding protein
MMGRKDIVAIATFCVSSLMCAGVILAESFDEQREAVAKSPKTQPEEAIVNLLEAGIAESKPTQAAAVARQWLQGNVAKDPLLLYHAGRAAELSGDWRGAVALHQQYLQRADLKSQPAADAVYAVYTLLIDQLNDPEAAYAYMSTEGHRLHGCGRAGQFDKWYFNLARERKDHVAVAERLLACLKSPAAPDVTIALYEDHFRWLLDEISNWRMDQPRFPAEFVPTVKALATAIEFDDELKRRLDWAVSVKKYNMDVIDGNDPVLPIEEATALLEKYPQHAELVQTGWAERRGPYYKDDPKKYWPLDLQAKMAPVRLAAGKFDPLQRAEFYLSWSSNYYSGSEVLNVEEARAFVLANPKIVNSKTGPALGLDWRSLSWEEASNLAPHLEQNPSPEASLVRAVAAAGEDKDLDKAMAALLGPEVWRLSERELAGSAADQLWHYCGRPGDSAKRDQEIAKTKKLVESISKPAVVAADAANKRMAEFKKLWDDFRSKQPKLPAVQSRLVRVLQVTPEAIPELLRDQSPAAQLFARDAIAKGFDTAEGALSGDPAVKGLSPFRYEPSISRKIARHGRNIDHIKNNMPGAWQAYPLEDELRSQVAERLKRGEITPWLTLAWINAQFMEDNEESLELMQQLIKSPAYEQLPYEVRFGARQWFTEVVLSTEQLAIVKSADPEWVCKDLIQLMEPPEDWQPKPAKDGDGDTDAEPPMYQPGTEKAIAALESVLDGTEAAPVRIEILGLESLAAVEEETFKDPRLQELLLKMAGPLRTFPRDGYSSRFTERFWQTFLNSKEETLANGLRLHETAPYFWRHTELYHRSLPSMIELVDSLVEDHPSAASTWARCGLQTLARYRSGHHYFNDDIDIPRLKSIRGKASLAMGLIEIPVPVTDAAYPIYRSQADYAIGNEDSALELYQEHAEQLLPIHRQLSVPYLLWVLQRTIDSRDEVRQEELVKALLVWSQETTSAFSSEQRIALGIAYGDIAMQRGMLPEAQKIYADIQNNEAYDGVFARHTATLRRVRVERISKDFDAALATLFELESEKVPQLTTEAHFARAEVFYDMEEYEDAAEQIAIVLKRDPGHSDATILRGRVQLKLKRLIEATEVELGSVTEQASLVPGEMLKVTLNDPTLSVSGGGTDIEVVVWTTSGDKEFLLLRQFGDEKTKYRGEVRTELGEPIPDDNQLQVVGDDEVFYAYSEAFRKKIANLEENRGGPITVASDAMLMASARKLLSENEQRVADMEAVAAALELKGSRSLANTDPELIAQLKAAAAERSRQRAIQSLVKPGNPIYLRVIDPDRGRTSEVDELTVSLSSSSGDTVNQVVLKETKPYSGTFEGSVSTSVAQAMAFASSSETGRNPNRVISPNTDYGAWRALPSKEGQTHFTVDLNDNAALGELEIVSSDPGFALKSFLIQTAMNRQMWTTVARSPGDSILVPKPWHPSVTVMKDTDRYQMGGRKSIYDELEELEKHLSYGYLTQQFSEGIALNVAGPSEAMPASVPGDREWKRQNHHANAHVVYRFQGWFYEPANATRRFRLSLGKHEIPKDTHPSLTSPPQFLLAVDGRPISEEDGKLEGEINLRAGLHRFEIWGIGWVQSTMGFGRETKVQANLNGDDQWIDCPDDYCDPDGFPEGELQHRKAPAEISATEDGTRFTVNFAKDSRARMLRILFVDQEGPVPALNKLFLQTPDGETLLPVPEDYAERRKNDSLEILTGDRVTVRYDDDRYVTRNKHKQERFLSVAFTDGEIEFADIEPRFNSSNGKKSPYYESLLRFQHGKAFPVVIRDADMDVSVEPDKVLWHAIDGEGKRREFVAVETGPSTGTFRTMVTPVQSKSTEAGEIYLPIGGALKATYRDVENDHPGVPTDRFASAQHAKFQNPIIELAHMKVSASESQASMPVDVLYPDFIPNYSGRKLTAQEQYQLERVQARYTIEETFVDANRPPEGGIEIVHGRAALIDVIVPHLALGTSATVDVFLQTEAGRKAARTSSAEPFDTDVPGTLCLQAQLGVAPKIDSTLLRGGYQVVSTEGKGLLKAKSAITLQQQYAEAGRFRLAVPLIAGVLPEESYADAEYVREQKLPPQHGLTVRSGEQIYIGFRYKDPTGKTKWSTATAKVITHPILDVMAEGYRNSLKSAYVGEHIHLRVLDLAADKTDGRDEIRCYMASKSGQKHYIFLRETDIHTGIFKGSCQLTYETGTEDEDYDVRRFGFPVVYGDAVGVQYTDEQERKTPAQYVSVGKGSDGTVAPFSKRFDDSDVAMQTYFAMAESYLELARRHRQTGEAEQAAREFTRAKQLLEGAISQFTDPDVRAHAEYLLGGLAQEDAEGTADDAELQRKRYQAALARFLTITGSYDDTPYASKAQFKIARIYEALDEPEIAAQEYVKLAYKYPDSEHLATAMARLGTHFQRKAIDFERQAAPILAKAEADPDDKDAAHEGEALQKLSRLEYIKAAQIFERLQTRFPNHELAGKAGLRAGQIYMRAEEFSSAVQALLSVVNNESYDGPTLRSEAMYWTGKCHQALRKELQAYALYKRITYDFPESKWAAYARGELSTERLLRLDRQLEIERLQEGQ